MPREVEAKGLSLLTLILIKLTVALVACFVTKFQEVPIRLGQIWRSVIFAYSVASWIIFIRVRVLSENKLSCAY